MKGLKKINPKQFPKQVNSVFFRLLVLSVSAYKLTVNIQITVTVITHLISLQSYETCAKGSYGKSWLQGRNSET